MQTELQTDDIVFSYLSPSTISFLNLTNLSATSMFFTLFSNKPIEVV